jgi:crotonobetainyl-CoA:carnitine CoA-transferase CaiB-like acyl-CoA transferase
MGPLVGIKVLELGQWIAAPAAACLLADWGAEVVKVEPPEGDPLRAMLVSIFPSAKADVNPFFEQVNRGKRSVAIDLRTEGGRSIFRQLVGRSDVLVTNLRPRALQQLEATYDELSALNPRLIYCQITGYGHDHEESDRALVDVGVYARLGMARLLSPAHDPEGEPPQEPNAIFDHTTGIAAAGAICAALLERERLGRGRWVGVPLIRTGAYMLAWDLLRAARLGSRVSPVDRRHVRNPLINCYRAGDGRWLWLLCAQPDRHWAGLCRALGREDLLEDPRFRDIHGRAQNAAALVEELDRAFARRPLAEWGPVLDRHGVWWVPVNSPNQAVEDPLVRKAGVFLQVPGGAGELVAGPAEFGGALPRGPAPELGQHTEEVLLELGYDWDGIGRLKKLGAII